MPLPVQFDQNEWFVIIALIISYSIIIYLPKKIPFSIFVLISVYALVIARMYDHMIASPTVDYYDIMDTTKYDLFDLLLYLLYPPFGYLFIYFYERWGIKGYLTLLYILIWSLLGMGFEYLASYFQVFQYKGWKIFYSFTVYLFTQSLTLSLYLLVKNIYNKVKRQSMQRVQE
jgi:hypothetical protein